MKFNYKAYAEVFPTAQPKPIIDSAVDGYTPTAEEAKSSPDLAIGTEEQPDKGAHTPADSAEATKKGENGKSGINDREETKAPLSGISEPTEGTP